MGAVSSAVLAVGVEAGVRVVALGNAVNSLVLGVVAVEGGLGVLVTLVLVMSDVSVLYG